MSDQHTAAEETRAQNLNLRLGEVLRPATPIESRDLFSGRFAQIESTVDAINQPGQHVMIYGERGVGKTSLANVLESILVSAEQSNFLWAKINCDRQDSFSSAWRKVLGELFYRERVSRVGFGASGEERRRPVADTLPKDPTPNDIRRLLSELGVPTAIIFDEFDRLSREAASAFTDLIKMLSDFAVRSTVILVGVADTVEQIVQDHASIDRALIQIRMPRMTKDELRQIPISASKKLEIEFEDEAIDNIVLLSQGLPHFTHSVGLYAVRSMLADVRFCVNQEDVSRGIGRSIENAQHSIVTAYHTATRSAQPDALFEQALLACALTRKDELSYFQSAAVVAPMSIIMRKKFGIPSFQNHLTQFCKDERGPVLTRIGRQRNYRYRFTNPLLQPFVIMQGLHKGLVGTETLKALTGE